MNTWQQLLCSLGFHKWGKWQFTNEHNYLQCRTCERCGIYETRLV